MFKRIKRLLAKRNNGGFTLVEVIVATALLAVLMLGMFGFIQPVLRSVKTKEQNARAVMLAETVENYIAGSTKYAYYVQTFSGVVNADVKSADSTTPATIATAKYVSNPDALIDKNVTDAEQAKKDAQVADKVFTASGDSLQKMYDLLLDVLGTENYEIRCIGMRWYDDSESGGKKLMLTNETVDQTKRTGAIDLSKSKLVFEPCFYDGLYPVLYFRNYTNQYQVLDPATKTLKDKFAESDLKIAPGLEITMDVYLDPSCYSINETTRTNANLSFSGTLFSDFRNISSGLNSEGRYKIQPNAQLHTYDEALGKSGSLTYNHPEVGNVYYPDTFIYFLARKTKTQGGAGGGTSTPTT